MIIDPISNTSHFRNYKQALELAKRKGFFIPILPVFLNYLEHSNLFYHEQNVEKLVYIQEGGCNIPIVAGILVVVNGFMGIVVCKTALKIVPRFFCIPLLLYMLGMLFLHHNRI